MVVFLPISEAPTASPESKSNTHGPPEPTYKKDVPCMVYDTQTLDGWELVNHLLLYTV